MPARCVLRGCRAATNFMRILLCDCGMLALTGWKVAHHIRANPNDGVGPIP
jgi:CheY-like chemotaxis protein